MKTDFINLYKSKIGKINEKVINLKRGGCGVYALYLYQHLQSLGISGVNIRPLLYKHMGYQNNDDFNTLIALNGKHKITFNHILVTIKDKNCYYTLDSIGVDKYDKPIKSGHIINESIYNRTAILGNVVTERDLELSLDIDLWNNAYDRTQNKLLKKLIFKIK